MSKEAATPNPCTDIQSVSIECQIKHLLECAMDVCDLRIHHNRPTTPQEWEETLWRIRLLVESARTRFAYGIEVEAFA